MSDFFLDNSDMDDDELELKLDYLNELRNRRANKSLKMPRSDIGTTKLPVNGKGIGYRPLSDNAKEKNAQLKREIKEILGIIDSEEKETEPKEKKFCAMFSWVQLFFCLAFLLLSFAVFCYYCASNKTQTSNTPIHSNNSVPSNVPEPPFLVVWYPVIHAIVFYIVTGSVILLNIFVFVMLVLCFRLLRRISASVKRREAEKMNEYYAKLEAEIDEEELENLRWDEI